MSEEHVDSYDATLIFRRDWNSDAAVAKGSYPSLPLDEAMAEHLLDEVQTLIDQGHIFANTVRVAKITPPDVQMFTPNKDTSIWIQDAIDHCKSILTSTKISDAAMKTKAWEELMSIFLENPEFMSGGTIDIAGKSVILSRKEYEEVKALLADDHKIHAIKALRTACNCGLKEAKDAVENTANFKR